jgi:hypothetical protein
LRTRDDTSAIYTYPPLDAQTTCFDDLFLNDCLVYKAHIKSSNPTKEKKGSCHGRAHGQPPEPDLSELFISGHHVSDFFSRAHRLGTRNDER